MSYNIIFMPTFIRYMVVKPNFLKSVLLIEYGDVFTVIGDNLFDPAIRDSYRYLLKEKIPDHYKWSDFGSKESYIDNSKKRAFVADYSTIAEAIY